MKRKSRQPSRSSATGDGESSLNSPGDDVEQADGLSEAPIGQAAVAPAILPPHGASGPSRFLRGGWDRGWLPGLLLVGATVLAYWPALHGGFVSDDERNIGANNTLWSPTGLGDIWLKLGATPQYYPLSYTLFWLGYHLWGLNTFGYHMLTLLLHCLTAMLLWQVLGRLRARGAMLTGAIFALHPVCVMSVAWMTELKNTLSAALVLAAGWAYLRFAGLGVYDGGDKSKPNTVGDDVRSPLDSQRLGSGDSSRRLLQFHAAENDWRYYVLSLGLFQLALLAKTAVSFLPVTLLLIVWWQRSRLRWRDLWPLIPMLGMALVMGQVTSYVERHSGGASGENFDIGFVERVLISGRSFWFYLGKLVFPYRLTFFYPRWRIDAGLWWQYVYPAGTVGVLWGLWGMRRRIGKGPFAAMLHFYIGASLLILLLVPYFTSFSFVSDHWQYFGCMSVIGLGAVGMTRALDEIAGSLTIKSDEGRVSGVGCRGSVPGPSTPDTRHSGPGFLGNRGLLKGVFCGVLLAVLGVLTWRQSRAYEDVERLWRTTIERNPGCWMAYNDLGNLLVEKGRLEEGILQFEKALATKPGYAVAHYNLGNALLQERKVDEAIAHFREVLATTPEYALAQNNLGDALLRKGQVDEAITHFREALAMKPEYAEAHNNLGDALHQKGQVDEAITQFQEALAISPGNAGAHFDLGNALHQRGQIDEAISHFQKALAIQPAYVAAHYNLGNVLFQKGQVDEAITHFERVWRSSPDLPQPGTI